MNKELRDELESIKKGLSESLPKDQVPQPSQVYFHNLTANVIQRARHIGSQASSKPLRDFTWEPWFMKITRPAWIAAFAGIALLLILFTFYKETPVNSQQEDNMWAEVPTSALESYIDLHVHDLDEAIVVRVAAEEGIRNDLFHDVETTEIEGYLNEDGETFEEDQDQFDL